MNRATYSKALFGAIITAAALTTAVAFTARADEAVASLARIEGSAVVSKGSQYVSATEGLGLKVGERVMSLAASATTIQFSDGCRYVLEANQLLTIEDKSPCALGLVGSQGGVATAAADGLGWLPVAAAGVLGVAAAAVDTGSDDRDRPFIFDTGGDGPRPPISQ